MTSPAAGPPPEKRDPQVDLAIHLIRERGGRSTTPRRVVLEALLESDGALVTAEELLGRIQGRHPDITESTVYRTLSLLEELDLVDHVHLGHGPSHWHVSGTRRQAYLTCNDCGQVIEVDTSVFDQFVLDVLERTGFSADLGHFALTGVCAPCRLSPRSV